MPGTWARSQARASPNCPHMHAQRPRTQGWGTSPRISITEARRPVNRGTRPAGKHDLDFDRGTAAWGRTMPGTWARSQARASPICPRMHAQRPRTQGRGTSPRITWTPKGLHHRSKATSKPRHATGWQARPGFRPRDRCLGARHARHMGTIPGTSITEFPTHARQLIGILGSGHLTWDHLDLEGAPSPKQGNQSPDAHDREACMA